MNATLQKIRRKVAVTVSQPVHSYRVDAPNAPVAQSVRITGPAAGFRLGRDGSHDFSCFSNLARTLVKPGMTDMEKAIAVYRFSTRFIHHGQIGFGGTEMTRFINCYGSSFCWGQACFQHLLYEAVGLLARSPILTGHSSVEVFIDGKWRAIDAYMRLLIPSPELDGIATGALLRSQPERFDHAREGPVLGPAKSYWAGHAVGGGTYEPWQDSRAMALSLRRGESIQMGPESRGIWCIAPSEPPHYLNGDWQWTPKLDETFLKSECDQHENLAAGAAGLKPVDAAKPSALEFTIKSLYPLIVGKAKFNWSDSTNYTLSISTDQRRTWKQLASGKGNATDAVLDAHLSLQGRPPNDEIAAYEKSSFVLRLTWTGGAALNAADVACVIQAHSAAWPQAERGANAFSSIGADNGATVEHLWDEYPGFTASDVRPFEGDEVTLTAVVHNTGTQPLTNVPVKFVFRSTGETLGECVVSRIEPGKSEKATFVWRATTDQGKARFGRIYGDDVTTMYAQTHIDARVGDGSAASHADGFTDVARLTLRVRPRPVPRFNENLIWVGPNVQHGASPDVTPASTGELVVRAAVIHQADPAHLHTYLQDSPLDVTVTLFDGPPDRGLQLAPPQRLVGIQPTEFAVAEWRLATATMPDTLDLWVQVTSGCPVAPENRNRTANRSVKVR